MYDRKTDAATTVLCFGLGALTGAVLGMLFAPAPGDETRDRVGRRIRETTESARDLKGRVFQKGEEALRKGQEAVHDVVRRAKETTSKLSAKASRELDAQDTAGHSRPATQLS